MPKGESTSERAKPIMRRIPISILLLAWGVGVCPAQQLEVTAVRFWTLSEVTRIAIETNGEFRFRSDRLNSPERLFFDLLGTKPRMGVKGVQTTPVGDKLLNRIRVAETQPGMTRVVLDLESAVDYTASQLTNPDRLMIELRPAPGSRPVSSSRPAPETSKPAEELSEPPRLPAKLVPDPGPQIAIQPPAPPPERPVTPVQPPALAAKRNSSGDRTLIRALGLKVGRVVIDPGHGGYDKGS